MTGAMTAPRIAILANHQHAGLAAALRALLPSARIDSFDLAPLARDGADRRLAIETVAACDHIVSQDVPAPYGPLATAALRAAGRRLQLLPVFRFAGFHPDSVAIALDGAAVAGPTGVLHSRVAVAAFLAGLPVRDAAALYNSLVFARLGYYAAFAAERARLLRTFAIYGYDIAACFDAWLAPGCFMFDATRPRMRVLLDLARRLCDRMAVTPEATPDSGAAEATVANPLATGPTQPLFPEIAARIGVRPEGNFRGPPPGNFGGPPPAGWRPALYSLEEFITASFDAYKLLPLAALRAVDGIASALPALHLAEADFGRAAARARAAVAAPDDTVFITWHGKLLATETATGALLFSPVWPEPADSTPATAPLPGGMQAAPGPHPGTVALIRQERRLIALPRALMPRFAAEAPPNADALLPLRRADLAALRTLAAGNWTTAPGAPAVPGHAMALRPGFVLVLGTHRFALATARISRAAAPVRIVIETPEHSVTFTEAAGAQTATVAAPADFDTLPLAASLEQFRAAPGHRLGLHGASEMIHLPLTVDNQARLWLHAAHRHGAPRLGRLALRATAVRAADKFIRLDRGSEGIIFDADAIWARPGFHAAAPSREAAGAAPELAGPVCVFYNPNLHDAYHWLAEAALALNTLLPLLPPQTRLLLPGTLSDLPAAGGFDHMAVLAALGLASWPTVTVRAPLVRAADVIWLEHDQIAATPAFLVQLFRTRVHALHKPPAARRRIYLRTGGQRRVANAAPVESFLQSRGFEMILPEDLAPADAIALFAAADFVVGAGGAAMAYLLFCQPGTRVLELAPDAAFHPEFWQISEKLGLCHAVLPCETIANGLRVDQDRFRALFKMLRLTSPN